MNFLVFFFFKYFFLPPVSTLARQIIFRIRNTCFKFVCPWNLQTEFTDNQNGKTRKKFKRLMLNEFTTITKNMPMCKVINVRNP